MFIHAEKLTQFYSPGQQDSDGLIYDNTHVDKLAEIVRNRRKELGYSQMKLAKLAGFKSQSGVSAIERGLHTSSTKLPQLAKALKISVEQLQTGIPTPLQLKEPTGKYLTEYSAQEQRLVSAFRKLSATQKQSRLEEIERMAQSNQELLDEFTPNKATARTAKIIQIRPKK